MITYSFFAVPVASVNSRCNTNTILILNKQVFLLPSKSIYNALIKFLFLTAVAMNYDAKSIKNYTDIKSVLVSAIQFLSVLIRAFV